MQTVSFGPENCWDCPLSLSETYTLLAVIVTCITLGVYLRGLGKPGLRTFGNSLLAFACLEIFTLNHAGRNWGVSRFGEYSNPNLISALSLLLALVGGGAVIYFERRAQRRLRESRE